MTKRLELMKYIIEKHKKSYHENFIDALLGIESISNTRLYMFEDEIIHSISNQQEISENTKKFLKKPTYGDGGMASAVRIASNIKESRYMFHVKHFIDYRELFALLVYRFKTKLYL